MEKDNSSCTKKKNHEGIVEEGGTVATDWKGDRQQWLQQISKGTCVSLLEHSSTQNADSGGFTAQVKVQLPGQAGELVISGVSTASKKGAGQSASNALEELQAREDLPALIENDNANGSAAEGGTLTTNWKSELQQWLQKTMKGTCASLPDYSTTQDLASGGVKAQVKLQLPGLAGEFVVSGMSMTSRKAAEQQAASKALEELQAREDLPAFTDSGNLDLVSDLPGRPSSPGSVAPCCELIVSSVLCKHCKAQIGRASAFFFFKKTEHDIQFALKPDQFCILQSLRMEADCSGKPVCSARVFCTLCSGGIGYVTTQLQNRGDLIVFSDNKVGFLMSSGEQHWPHGKRRWATAMKHPAFHHVHRSYDYSQALKPVPSHLLPPELPLVTPLSPACPLSREDCLDWRDCVDKLSGLTPRAEQIEAFRLCVLQNHIVVLPTGLGKTLIASMVMKRMAMLNPSPGRLALMIVDRIPLVEQQKRALEDHTGLLAASLCSETSTCLNKQNLFSGNAHALVATAGALLRLLHEDTYGVKMSSFSVAIFDECHHACGRHDYAQLLKLIQDIDPRHRPRVVGLTASPCKAGTVHKAMEALAALIAKFGDETLLYKPKLLGTRAQDITVTVEDSPEQLAVARRLWDSIQRLCCELGLTSNNDSSAATSLDELMDANSIGQITGLAREVGAASVKRISGDDRAAARALSEELMRLLAAWESNSVLGPYAAKWFMSSNAIGLHGSPGDAVSAHTQVPPQLLSAQLIELERRICEAGDDLRCLVFVDTKDTAEMLTRRFQAIFPRLHPDKAVGQMGPLGMSLPQQRKKLRRFREGECRLIVCTSVLEEGFDVPTCNLVFRIHGRASLIQQVQSRGRARAAHGKLVTICSKSYEGRAKMLRDQESNLERALSIERGKARQAMLRIQPRALDTAGPAAMDSGSGTVLERSIQELARCTPEDLEAVAALSEELAHDAASGRQVYSVALKIFLLVSHDATRAVDANILESILETALVQQTSGGEANDHLRIDIRPPGGANLDLGIGSCVLHNQATVAILSIPTGSRQFFKWFVSGWSFKVKGAEDVSIALQASAVSRAAIGGPAADEFQQCSNKTIPGVSKVSVGYMPKHGTFVSCKVLSDLHEGSGGAGSFVYHSMEIHCGAEWRLRASPRSSDTATAERPWVGNGSQVEVAASISVLGPCVYVSAIQGDGTIVLYMPLRSTPTVLYRHNTQANWRRAVVPVEPDACHPGCAGTANGVAECQDQSLDPAQRAAEDHLRCLASQPVLAVEFDENHWDDLVAALVDPRNLGVPALVTRVHGHFDEPGYRGANGYTRGVSLLVEDEAILGVDKLEQDAAVTGALLAFACLETHIYCLPLHPRCLDHIFGHLRSLLNEHRQELRHGRGSSGSRLVSSTQAMQDLHSTVMDGYPFVDAASLYDEHVRLAEAYGSSSLSGSSDDDDSKYFDNARVVATPSRLICKPPVRMKSGRLMRLFAPSHRLVYVTFRDEEEQKIYTPSVFAERYRHMLEPSGIPSCQLQGLRLRLLVCSASQMREQTAVFVVSRSPEEIERMRAQLIPNRDKFEGEIFKYMSRLGLFCTADYPVLKVPQGDWETMKDARTAVTQSLPRAKVLTDGSGFIDSYLLSRVDESVVPPGCCAIQIRHSGSKGVLVSKDLRGGKRVIMRESMVKIIDSEHHELCVVKAATYNRLRLNRDVLNLLFSLSGEGQAGGDWEALPVVFAMQETELARLAMMLTDPEAALKELVHCGVFDRQQLRALAACGEVFPNEPHFQRLLQHMYDYNVRQLRSKTQIPVQEGALLMGIPDPLGILNDGEIFIQIQKESHAERITGPVLLYRNPLLHAGDMRVLDAVACKELSKYFNVVVFPAVDGGSTRCIPSECSGGDLDGDMFSCIWDNRLVPPAQREVEPCDYEELLEKARPCRHERPCLTVAELCCQ